MRERVAVRKWYGIVLGEDSDVWHGPRRELGDLVETRFFAFLRGFI